MRIASISLICISVLFLIIPERAGAASSFNSKSGMGINLAGIAYYSAEQPFINDFANAERWVTHSDDTWDTQEDAHLDLDANGWPRSLKGINETSSQRFNSVGVLFTLGMPETKNGRYPAGAYVVLYEGQGTLSYGLDAVLIRRSPGRDFINITPTDRGIDLRIVETDPTHSGSYVRNIMVVTEANEAAAKAGEIFNPSFLGAIRNFRALRFMDWLRTNGSTLSSWVDRPLPSQAFFGTAKGVPMEVAVQLANVVSADAWMNVPVMADDDFIRKMATLVHDRLGISQKIYVELSNEVWNSSFSQSKYAASQGQALWRTVLRSRGEYEYNRDWFGMRTAQMCDIWRAVWGSDRRLVCVLGAQAAWSSSATRALKCPYWIQGAPCSGHAIDAVAIAPYMGDALPSAWTFQPDGGLNSLFQSLNAQNAPNIPKDGFIAQDGAWIQDYMTKLAAYKLPLLAYEGGQNFANGATDGLNDLYVAANRDPRMAEAYARYFRQWRNTGGQLFMYFNDIGVGGRYGSWGALESIMQSITPLGDAPPKWQAIQKFISANPCWWPACAGAIAAGEAAANDDSPKAGRAH